MQLTISKKQKNYRKEILFLAIIYLAFIALGLPDTGFGVAWNEMHLELGVPLELAGGVTIVITIFSALSGFLSGDLLERFGTGKVTAISCLATGIAIMGFAFSQSYLFFLLMAIPLGFGAGAVDSGLNSYAAENLSSKHMNWLHCSWGIGATLSPLIITSAITGSGSWRYGYSVIGVSVLIFSFILIASLPLWKKETNVEEKEEAGDTRPYVKGMAPFLSILSYVLYVGIEGGLGLWLSALLIESRGLDIGLSGTIVGVYFGSIMTGRFLMGFVANRLGNRKVISIGLTMAFIGAIAFCIPSSPFLYGTGILLIGLGFAPIYPSLMHETSNRYGRDQAKKIIGHQVAFSYISILLFIPLLGFIATHTDFEVIPYMTLCIIVTLIFVIRKLNQLT